MASVLIIEQAAVDPSERELFQELRDKLGLPRSETIDPAHGRLGADSAGAAGARRFFKRPRRSAGATLQSGRHVGRRRRDDCRGPRNRVARLDHRRRRRGVPAAHPFGAGSGSCPPVGRQGQGVGPPQRPAGRANGLSWSWRCKSSAATRWACRAALDEIRTQHFNEPGVADATYQLLYTAGLLAHRAHPARHTWVPEGRAERPSPRPREPPPRVASGPPARKTPQPAGGGQAGDLDAVIAMSSRRRSPLHGAGPRACSPRRGLGRAEPHGGLRLVRDGAVVGEGWHRQFGGPHAEVEALAAAGEAARGATAYVTLEPCCHTGKTPPCTRALVAAGVSRVVAAAVDPNPAVNGGGFAEIASRGHRRGAGRAARVRPRN